jgi:hypothetical protein
MSREAFFRSATEYQDTSQQAYWDFLARGFCFRCSMQDHRNSLASPLNMVINANGFLLCRRLSSQESQSEFLLRLASSEIEGQKKPSINDWNKKEERWLPGLDSNEQPFG